MILLEGGLTIKTIILFAGFAILICGICMGSGKKNNKDTGKYYDKKEENPLIHAAKLSDPHYAPKGSGYYKDKNGNKQKEKKG